jgi:hypothetical protein
MERDISWSAVLPGQGADVALTVTSAEAWFSLAAIACATSRLHPQPNTLASLGPGVGWLSFLRLR